MFGCFVFTFLSDNYSNYTSKMRTTTNQDTATRKHICHNHTLLNLKMLVCLSKLITYVFVCLIIVKILVISLRQILERMLSNTANINSCCICITITLMCESRFQATIEIQSIKNRSIVVKDPERLVFLYLSKIFVNHSRAFYTMAFFPFWRDNVTHHCFLSSSFVSFLC